MSIIGRPLITGSGGGGSATLITKSITANGTYNASSDNADGYSSVTVNVGGSTPITKKDVNFYDYDGTLLHSYTAQEASALTALPANPSHTGLTAQGWNYTLAQMKTQVTAMGACDIGQMYVTDDGKTRLYCHFEYLRLSPYLGICPKGTVTVDWGDGSATDTLTGTSLTTPEYVQHNYASSGDYVIRLTAATGTTFAFYGNNNIYSCILRKTNSTSATAITEDIVYKNAIQKIELGPEVSISQYAFYYCYSLSSITIPSTVSNIGDYAFYQCYSLRSISIPSSVTSINQYAIYGIESLQSISIPSSVTSINQYAISNLRSIQTIILPLSITSLTSHVLYQNMVLDSMIIPSGVTSIATYAVATCYSLRSISIPSSVASIGTYAFRTCTGLGELILNPTTVATVANSNAWNSLPTDCKIYIPFSGLASYLSASNYPAKATYTYIGFATYESGTTLPTQDSTQAYNVTWYASKADAIAETNAITTGNGSEIYCRYVAV